MGKTSTHPLLLALADIKLAHSVFAMPFALLAAVLAAPGAALGPRFVGQAALVILSMFFARTWAMLVNRIADWRFDRDNARTARRVIASGRLSPSRAWAVALGSASAFAITCAGFWFFFDNHWPLLLCAPVLAWIALYSYTKRFTALCHLFLGAALAASPLAAAIAVEPSVFTSSQATSGRAIIFLAIFVLFWVAGFDIAYALQDIEFDRRTRLRSIPARLGLRGSLWVSRIFHLVAFAMLTLAIRAEPRFGTIMLAALLLVALILIFEHIILARRGVAGLPLAFFTLNGVVSCLLGAAGIVDMWL